MKDNGADQGAVKGDVQLSSSKAYHLFPSAPQLAKLYLKEGLSLAVIASRVGISKTTVGDRLRRAGIKLRTGPETRCLGAPTPELARLYFEENLPPAQIADHLGITKSAVLSRLIRARHKLRPRGAVRGRLKVPGVKTEQLVQALLDGLNYSEIAERFGISRPAVVYRLKLAGCELPEHKHTVDLPWEEIIALYVNERVSAKTIAERFHVGVNTVCRGLAKRGVKLRHRAAHMKDWHAEQKQLMAEAKRILADTEESSAKRSATGGGHPGAPTRWSDDTLEKAIVLHSVLKSWPRVAKKLTPDEHAKNPKAAADCLRQAVTYYLVHRKADERKLP